MEIRSQQHANTMRAPSRGKRAPKLRPAKGAQEITTNKAVSPMHTSAPGMTHTRTVNIRMPPSTDAATVNTGTVGNKVGMVAPQAPTDQDTTEGPD